VVGNPISLQAGTRPVTGYAVMPVHWCGCGAQSGYGCPRLMMLPATACAPQWPRGSLVFAAYGGASTHGALIKRTSVWRRSVSSARRGHRSCDPIGQKTNPAQAGLALDLPGQNVTIELHAWPAVGAGQFGEVTKKSLNVKQTVFTWPAALSRASLRYTAPGSRLLSACP